MVYRTLREELAELERTDPAVKVAAERYDFEVWRILRKAERRAARADQQVPTA